MYDKTKTNLILLDTISLALIISGLTSTSGMLYSVMSVTLGWLITIGVIVFLASKNSLEVETFILKIPETAVNLFISSVSYFASGNDLLALKLLFWSLATILLWILVMSMRDLFKRD